MADLLPPERRSWLMSRIGSKNTQPELALRRALYLVGLRGWRLHSSRLPGCPDVVFVAARVAVFVDGSFWHGHPTKYSPGRLPQWWEKKIERNMARDKRTDAELKALGWRVIRVWDIEVHRDPLKTATRVKREVERRKQSATAARKPSAPKYSRPRRESARGKRNSRAIAARRKLESS